jgi:hypothetical protein
MAFAFSGSFREPACYFSSSYNGGDYFENLTTACATRQRRVCLQNKKKTTTSYGHGYAQHQAAKLLTAA